MTKISALPSVSSLSGSEVMPVVSGGVTSQIAVSDVSKYVLSNTQEILKQNRTYYVRTDGNDNNDGLTNTPAGAFKTITRAINAAKLLNWNGYTVTIKVNDGTYNENVTVAFPFTGAVSWLIIEGNPTSPQNVVVNGRFRTENFATISVNGFTVSPSGLNALQSIYYSQLYASNVHILASSSATAVYSLFYGSIFLSGTNAFGNNTTYFFAAERGGYISLGGTWSLLGNVTYTATAYVKTLGTIFNAGATFSLGAYTVTGTRYQVIANSVIDSSGVGVNWLPGSAAGTTSNGGQYI